MNTHNYPAAFNKLFNGYTTGNELWRRTDANWAEIQGTLNIGGKDLKGSYVHAYFYHNHETYIHSFTNIQFIKIPKMVIKEIFNKEVYNYDLVEEIINEMFKIGQSFGFYKNMSTIKNIRIEDSLSSKNFGMPVLKNVSKLTFADFLKDGKSISSPIKRMVRQSIRYKWINDNICPLIEIMIPYSNTDFFNTVIHLHPSMRDIQIKKIEQLKAYFSEELEKRLDVILNKKIKIHQNDLINMSLQDKLNYVPVLEMMTV